LVLDGIFGQKTLKETVKIIQKELNLHRSANLSVDGLFGVKTRAAFNRRLKREMFRPWFSVFRDFSSADFTTAER